MVLALWCFIVTTLSSWRHLVQLTLERQGYVPTLERRNDEVERRNDEVEHGNDGLGAWE